MIYRKRYLEVSQLSKFFFHDEILLKILDKVNYCFNSGVSYALTGVSGAGKSTLISLLSGLILPTSGTILLDNKDISTLPSVHRAQMLQQHLGLIFQMPYLLDELTVVENVMIKGLIAKQPYTVAYEKALTLLKQVGLHEKAQQRSRVLSGGEQQRVAIARALFGEPSFILADEPTAHLDEKTAENLVNLLTLCCRQTGAGLLVASHNKQVMAAMDITLEITRGSLCRVEKVPAVTHEKYITEQCHGR